MSSDIIYFGRTMSETSIIEHNLEAVAKPVSSDDITQGWSKTSQWQFAGISWECVSNTAGNAVWKRETVSEEDEYVSDSLPVNETRTIPSGKQMIISGRYELEGILNLEGVIEVI